MRSNQTKHTSAVVHHGFEIGDKINRLFTIIILTGAHAAVGQPASRMPPLTLALF